MKKHPIKNIWITGASSGIGKEIALQLAQQKHRVFISARNADLLQAMASRDPQHLIAVPADLADEGQVKLAVDAIGSQTPVLDLVILNAGTCEYLDNGIIDTALTDRVMSTNFLGAVYSAAACMPLLQKSSSPALYVVSSQVTSLPITRSEAYGASKAALEYFFRTLRIDWREREIHVGIVRPGFVKTPLTDKNDFSMPGIWPTHKAASTILRGIEKRRLEIVFPCSLRIAMAFLSAMPQAVWLWISQGMVRQQRRLP